MAKFKNKYRIESNRLQNWDYSNNGRYFITIVTNNRTNWFGKITNKIMYLSDFGKIVKTEWLKSFEIRNELFLDTYVIMPNHLHAIVTINNVDDIIVGTDNVVIETDNIYVSNMDGTSVETNGRSSLPSQSSQSSFQQKPKSISSFMGGFKSATTNKIDDFIDFNNLDIPKFNRKNRLWQTNYHDHIIRNDKSYYNISNYIKNNPLKWDDDKFHT